MLRYTYTINGSSIDQVSVEQNLGAHFNSDLTYNEHVNKVVSKADKMVRLP